MTRKKTRTRRLGRRRSAIFDATGSGSRAGEDREETARRDRARPNGSSMPRAEENPVPPDGPGRESGAGGARRAAREANEAGRKGRAHADAGGTYAPPQCDARPDRRDSGCHACHADRPAGHAHARQPGRPRRACRRRSEPDEGQEAPAAARRHLGEDPEAPRPPRRRAGSDRKPRHDRLRRSVR